MIDQLIDAKHMIDPDVYDKYIDATAILDSMANGGRNIATLVKGNNNGPQEIDNRHRYENNNNRAQQIDR